MFIKARLKLTGWYLIIIMVVSATFSGVIYRASSFEIERFASAQRMRYERRMVDDNKILFEQNYSPLPSPPILDQELINETKQRILTTLLFINFGIIGFAGILGYYLSGKTLLPIQEMMDEQYRFVSDASHELKTPITAIKTTLEVAIRDKNLKLTEAKNTLLTSLEEVDRLQKLAEGLLELTHNNGVGDLIATNLVKVIEISVKMVEPLAIKKKISIVTKINNMNVMVDELSIVRAIVAIIDNAIKYSPIKSKIEVIGNVQNKMAKIQIIDHGAGISENETSMVFDRFYRTDPARSSQGYGLGLSIAKKIIEKHNGNIEIESKLGKGTKVTINLPFSAKIQ